MKRGLFRAAAIAVAVMALLQSDRLHGCSPSPIELRFWFLDPPESELHSYLAGELGILDPLYQRMYHFVAYRHLSGLGLDAESRQALESFWPSVADDPYELWVRARSGIPGLEDLPQGGSGTTSYGRHNRVRESRREVDGYLRLRYYLNCNDDAFSTAARTLAIRTSFYDPESEEVRRWVRAQDVVFANCTEGRAIPDPPGADWDSLAVADREYQIAAAHFYAGEFEEAEQRFRTIADDPRSPWRILSAYLVARALIRRATVGDGPYEEALTAAATQLRAVLADPEYQPVHAATERLLGYVLFRIDPEGRRPELAELLARERLPDSLPDNLKDYFRLIRGQGDYRDDDNDMTEWLKVIWDETPEGAARAVSRWRERRTEAWLVAALMKADADHPGLQTLLEAASEVEKGSPAFLTVAFHQGRLLIESGRLEQARSLLDPLLTGTSSGLSHSDCNRFSFLRFRASRNLDEFLEFSQQAPVEVGLGSGASLSSFGRRERPTSAKVLHRWPADGLEGFLDGSTLPFHEAVSALNFYFTPALLAKTLTSDKLASDLRRRILLAGWSRAILESDRTTAVRLASVLQEEAPELHDALDEFLGAPPGAAADFAAALVFLRFPGLNAKVEVGVGRGTSIAQMDAFRANWWCGGEADFPPEPAEPGPAFLTPAQRLEAAAMRARLSALESGPNHLGRIVLAWAKAQPDDERVPEALHLVVRATRHGCTHSMGEPVAYGEVSRAAFELLHNRYPDSSWAARTKYWFN